MSDPVIDAYRARQVALDESIRSALVRYFATQDFSDPERVRDELIVFIPSLVDRFGPVSAELAVEYYEEARAAAGAAGKFVPAPVDARLSDEHMEQSVRRLAGDLWSDNPEGTATLVGSKVTRWVRAYGRRTVEHNVHREGAGFARVPKGSKTCSFCLMLASRGVSYKSRGSAGASRKYHDDCDCEVVRVEPGGSYPAGYLPDDFHSMYREAVEDSGSNKLKDIAASFRRLHPDAVTDGVTVK